MTAVSQRQFLPGWVSRPSPAVWLLVLAAIGLVAGSLNSSQFAQQTVAGLASGAVFASLALALVLIYRATEVLNFAQGAMAMFTTYVAYELMHWGLSYWAAFVATLAIAFLGGVGIERTLIRPVQRAGVLTVVIVTIGLLILLEGVAAWIWTPAIKPFPSAFSAGVLRSGGAALSYQDLGTIGVSLATVVTLWLFFRFTKLGLGMRAAALRPGAARLVGVRVGWMLALGWGLAAVLGAVSGLLIAPSAFLQPSMMDSILIYSFAAAVVGGIENPAGAVVGGLGLGVLLNLLATYVHFIAADAEWRLPVALGVLLAVLVVKPTGLFGHRVVRRV